MKIDIVCGNNVITEFKKSHYFKKDLGFASSIEDSKSGERIYSTKDHFAVMYNLKYKTAIYKKGKVGNYAFYLDAYILDNSIATYCDELEFIIKYDPNKVRTDGINSYIGYIIRSVIEHKSKMELEKNSEVVDTKVEPDSGKSRLLVTPGAVRYEDVQEYLRNKNKI